MQSIQTEHSYPYLFFSSRELDQRGSNHHYRSQDNNKRPSQVTQNNIDSGNL